MSREYNVKIFEQTMDMCRRDPELAKAIKDSLRSQRFVSASEAVPSPIPAGHHTEYEVTGERSFQASERLDGKVCVLNFASYANPGGGVAYGSSAQEESLCRISTLYPCISSPDMMRLFYIPHRQESGGIYSSDIIYTPGVVVLRSDDDGMEVLPASGRYQVDVVTCAAPNLNWAIIDDDDLYEIQKERIGRVIDVAASNGAESLVLGAFGCGVFGNDPAIVAKASKDALSERPGCFRKVVFAIYGSFENLSAFRDVFGCRARRSLP